MPLTLPVLSNQGTIVDTHGSGALTTILQNTTEARMTNMLKIGTG